MGRTLMSPDELNCKRECALFLLEGGLSSYRAVADVLDVDHTTIRAWDGAREADGSPAPVRFDRHQSGGASWDKEDAEARQQVRARRRAVAAVPAIIDGGPGRSGEPDDEAAPPKFRRRRSRQCGPRLQAFLDERARDGSAITVADFVARQRDEGMEFDAYGVESWVTPALRQRVEGIVAHVGAMGISTRALVSRLPSAYDEDDPDFLREFERVLRGWALGPYGDGRWRRL